jgi:hypothetical protein
METEEAHKTRAHGINIREKEAVEVWQKTRLFLLKILPHYQRRS